MHVFISLSVLVSLQFMLMYYFPRIIQIGLFNAIVCRPRVSYNPFQLQRAMAASTAYRPFSSSIMEQVD